MDQLKASRLKRTRRSSGFLSRFLPHGSTARRILIYYGLPVLVLLILGLIVDMIVMPIMTRHGEEFPLPEFAGQRIFEAQITLKELSLSHQITSEEFSAQYPKGTIIGQFPVAGTQVKPDRTIKFVLSQGQMDIAVPEVHGLSVRQAMLNLETSRLTLGEIEWAYSDSVPERVVIFSYPVAGTQVPIKTPINLMVNRGRAMNFTYMPKLVGLPITEAIKKLRNKGLEEGVASYRTDENYLPETVLEQSEAPGTELDIGTEIDLVVSST